MTAEKLAARGVATMGDIDLAQFWPVTARLICAVHDCDPELLELLSTLSWDELMGALVLACLNVPERLVINAQNGFEIDDQKTILSQVGDGP